MSKNPVKKLLLNNFLKRVVVAVGEGEFKTLADVGCGEGMVIRRLLDEKKVSPALVTGIDLSKKALSIAKKINPSSHFRRGSIMELPLENGEADLTICLEVLEHVTPPKKALAELIRVTKKRLILSVPDEPLFSYLRMLALQDVFKLGKHEEHINFWNVKSFEKFLKRNAKGFRVTVSKSTPWLLAVLER